MFQIAMRLGCEERIQFPGPLQISQIIRTADMLAIDEDLRNSRAAIGALNHFLTLWATHADFIFFISHTLFVEQRFRARAIRTSELGVDFNLGHIR